MNTTDIQVFENVDFGKVRIIELDGEPWFVGKDVAEILGYQNASKAVSTHVDNEDKAFIMVDIADSQNGNVPTGKTKTAIINESGLYSLILSSKLPKAKEFKHWVTSDVIPSIRKTGRYTAPNAAPNVPDMGKLSLTTQCLINLELQSNKLRKDLDGALKRIEELERGKPETAKPEPERPVTKPEPKPWSERELDYLRKAYALGQTDTEIAADMGRTVDSIKNKRRVLGLCDDSKSNRHWRPGEDKKLIKYYNQGVAFYDIGQLLGRSVEGVQGRLHRLRKAGKV